MQGLLALATVHDLSLRTLEQVSHNIALVFLSNDNRYVPPLICGLAVMRIADPELYERARTGRLNKNNALQFLRFDEWDTEKTHAETVKRHKDTWTYATGRDDELNQPTRQWASTWERAMTGPQLMKMTCKQIDDLWWREPQ